MQVASATPDATEPSGKHIVGAIPKGFALKGTPTDHVAAFYVPVVAELLLQGTATSSVSVIFETRTQSLREALRDGIIAG